ncbi:hypothetical protein HZB74_03250 [Candidatus Saccharibacteria bacterium]|nr:hypothetical protein [Candidatus Saccharibacteria bacterium]
MNPEILEKFDPESGDKTDDQLTQFKQETVGDQEDLIIHEDVAKTGLAYAINATKNIKLKFTPERKEKKSGGGSVWWFSPCGEHSVARYVCCTGGRCESWKKD